MFNKKENVDYKNKKYLLAVFALMIVAFVGLWLVNLLGGNEKQGNLDEVLDKLTQTESSAMQSYIPAANPELRDGDRVLGNREAQLQVFVYENYDDNFSADFSKTINQLIREKGNEVSVVLRPFIGSSQKSAEYALALDCAGDNWQSLRNMIMTSASDNLNAELDDLVKELNIDGDSFTTCLTDAKKSGRIEQLQAEAINYEIFGSPTIFIDNQLIVGARPYDNYVDSNGDEINGLKILVERFLLKN